ncbi:hypothetical protein [Xanthobacter sediminis]|uniref:hypothetical protein n=1 Tax=Xanthobacter sediminis TaxID=3119926 RepID=UPI003729CA5C
MMGVRLRHLTFTGPATKPAELTFQDGLNIVYGASNTGKSFASKAVLFMLGAAKALPETEEIAAYNACWLGMTLPGERNVTLYRSTRGGHFKIHEGLIRAAGPDEGTALRGQHDSKRDDTVSHLLLSAMSLAGRQIVRDANGAKDMLSIFRLAPYAVVSEEDIIAERSPVFTGQPAERTFEQNLFKLLLTGIDDTAAVTVQKPSDRKVAKAAKIELVDELIEQLDKELGDEAPDEKELTEQLDRLERSATSLLDRLRERQMELDSLVGQRRSALDRSWELGERVDELGLTLERFARLQAVYSSDLERLQSIEEGGFVLVAMAGMDCPVCGAPPEAQRHNHAAEEIEMAHKAASAEARKIEREQRELTQTISSLEAEASGLRRTMGQLAIDVEKLEEQIEDARPQEATARQSYEMYMSERTAVMRVLDLYERRSKLLARKAELESQSTKREGDALAVGPDSTTAFKFGETVKSVLTAWRFPDADKVQFDLQTNDITIAGKRRSANGKGVRAILHAAFNVAVIVYAIENQLPHPGFLVLDTPLLTYREPMTSRHGELAADEAALKATSLAEHFYRYLAGLSSDVQFVVIENSDPPAAIQSIARIETFTGLEGNGRFGLLARRT